MKIILINNFQILQESGRENNINFNIVYEDINYQIALGNKTSFLISGKQKDLKLPTFLTKFKE